MQGEGSAKNRRTILILVSILVFVALAITCSLYAVSTPYYSLYMLKKAIVNRDARGVLKYLDTDSIVDNMAKDVFAKIDKKEQPRNKLEESFQGVGKDVAAQLLPQIKKQMGEAITNLLLSYGDESSMKKLKDATIFGLSVTVNGNQAQVRARGKDKVSFTMTKAPEGHWRITSLDPDELKLFGK